MAPNGRLTLFEHYDIFVCPLLESMPECLALQQKYASLFHIKKCSTQYVAHFIWVTDSLKIGEYNTICSTLYYMYYPPGGSLLSGPFEWMTSVFYLNFIVTETDDYSI